MTLPLRPSWFMKIKNFYRMCFMLSDLGVVYAGKTEEGVFNPWKRRIEENFF